MSRDWPRLRRLPGSARPARKKPCRPSQCPALSRPRETSPRDGFHRRTGRGRCCRTRPASDDEEATKRRRPGKPSQPSPRMPEDSGAATRIADRSGAGGEDAGGGQREHGVRGGATLSHGSVPLHTAGHVHPRWNATRRNARNQAERSRDTATREVAPGRLGSRPGMRRDPHRLCQQKHAEGRAGRTVPWPSWPPSRPSG